MQIIEIKNVIFEGRMRESLKNDKVIEEEEMILKEKDKREIKMI